MDKLVYIPRSNGIFLLTGGKTTVGVKVTTKQKWLGKEMKNDIICMQYKGMYIKTKKECIEKWFEIEVD